MKQKLFCLIITLLWLASVAQALSIKPTVSLRTDKSKAVIGELITIIVEVKSSVSDSIICDFPTDAFAKVHILKDKVLHPKNDGQKITWREIIFTSIDSGNFRLSSFPVIISNASQNDTLFTPVVNIHFSAEKIIATLHDIKPQEPTQFTFFRHPLFLYPAIAFIIICFAFPLVLKYSKKQTKLNLQEEQDPTVKLQKLENELKSKSLLNAEVTAKLTAILNSANQKDAVQTTRSNMKTVGKIAEKLERLQFGPEADKAFKEELLLQEIKAVIANTQIRKEAVQ